MASNRGYDSTNDSTNTTTNGLNYHHSDGSAGDENNQPPPPFSNKSSPIGESLNSLDDDHTLIPDTNQTYFADERVLIPEVDKVNLCLHKKK